jgi:ParB family transcriptional regulator, chromosome partitioning protein
MALPTLPAQTSPTESAPRFLGIDQLKRGRWQPRRHFDPQALAELAESIEQHGILQPIVVRYDKTDGHYEIIAGERRWRAAMQASLHQVPVITRNELSLEQAAAASLIENIQREDLTPIEEAQALQRLIEEFKLTHQEAAQSTGKSRSHVTNLLRLLELATPVQELLDQGQLDVGHAKPLLALPKRHQVELANMAVRRHWSVRILTERVNDLKNLLSGESTRSPALQDPNLVRIARQFTETYCLPCRLTYSEEQAKGQLVITYHSLEELQGLLEAWGFEEPPGVSVKRP